MILKEYLIALGFKVDETSLRRFNDYLQSTTKTAASLGSQVVATATAVELAVVKITDQFTQLYYASSRTDAAVSKLQGFEYGARQIGLTSDKARSAVEGLARAMRTSPGIEALVNQLGVSTKGRDTTDVLNDIVGKLREMPFYLAAQYGQLLGQSPDDLLMLFQRYERAIASADEFRKRQKAAGIDAKDLAQRSAEFDRNLGHLASTFDLLSQRVAISFLPAAEKVIKVVDGVVEAMVQWDKTSGGWVTWWGTLATSALGVFLARATLVRLGLIKLGEAAAGASAALGASLLGRLMTGALRLGGPIGILLGSTVTANEGEVDLEKLSPADREAAIARMHGGGRAPQGRQELGRYITEFFRSQGWSREQAAGLTANADRESGLRHTATGDAGRAYGLFQWHPDRQKAFRNWSGKDIRDATVDDQLKFAHYELTQGAERAAGDILRRTRTASEAGAAVSRFYERPANAEGEAALRGSSANRWFQGSLGPSPGSGPAPVTIQQKTDIHVAPGPDARETAGRVTAGQSRVNGDLVRNLEGATR